MIGAFYTLTVVHYDKLSKGYDTFKLEQCTWVHTKEAILTSDGYFKKSDSIVARIPISDDSKSIKKGDLVLLGDIELPGEFRSFAELKKRFPDHMTVTNIKINEVGSPVVNHVKIEGE